MTLPLHKIVYFFHMFSLIRLNHPITLAKQRKFSRYFDKWYSHLKVNTCLLRRCSPPNHTFKKHLQHLKQWCFLEILHVFHKTKSLCCGASHALSLDTKFNYRLLIVWVQWPYKDELLFMFYLWCFPPQILEVRSEIGLFGFLFSKLWIEPHPQIIVKDIEHSQWLNFHIKAQNSCVLNSRLWSVVETAKMAMSITALKCYRPSPLTKQQATSSVFVNNHVLLSFRLIPKKNMGCITNPWWRINKNWIEIKPTLI
jgi:hypothetical protein